MKKSVSIIYFFLLLLISCKEKTQDVSNVNSFNLSKEDVPNNNLTQDSLRIKKILRKQLEAGKSALYDNSFDISTYKFTSEDLEVIIPIIKSYLKEYKTPSDEEFSKQIKKIFGRTIDFNSDSKYLYVNLENKNDKKFKFFRNDNSIEIHPYSVFIIKEHNFITELYAIPEILDYRNKYIKISSIEDNMDIKKIDKEGNSIKAQRWLDFTELNTIRQKNIKTLIARNKYLFNNDKSQLDWLLNNDKLFMLFILKTYNYSKDDIHKGWYQKMNN